MSRYFNQHIEQWENNMIPKHEICTVLNNMTDAMVDIIFAQVRLDVALADNSIDPDGYDFRCGELVTDADTIHAMWNMLCH